MDYGIQYQQPRSRDQATTSGSVDLINGGLQPFDYTGNVDSDNAYSGDDRRSVTGYVYFLASGPDTRQSKTQQSVALSTMEAEYMSLAAEVQDVEHQRMVFDELGLLAVQSTIIKEDYKTCQLIADHLCNFQRTKTIDVRNHFVRERIQRGSVHVDYVPTTDNDADMLTKTLPRELFIKFYSMLVVSKSTNNFIAYAKRREARSCCFPYSALCMCAMSIHCVFEAAAAEAGARCCIIVV